MKITRVYIDGFNLYHGIIRDNRLHWLDLQSFAEKLNRNQPVDHITFCTAMVSGTITDPDKALRQEVYHRALALACPKVEILKGMFTSHIGRKPLAGCKNTPACLVQVVSRCEKGSDVNLASRLLFDAHAGRYDRAIVVSGDSDLMEPIRLVAKEMGKEVWVRNPRNVSSVELEGVATHYDRIRPAVLQASQLPDLVTDGLRAYHKPAKWSAIPAKLNRVDIVQAPCPISGCVKQIKTCHFA